METDTKIFLKKKFAEYYAKNRISAPREIQRREFGTGTLTDKIKIRHKSFRGERELHDYLRREAPFYISYSIAYYEFPENQPMTAKNWSGADLVFDLDIAMDIIDSEKLDIVKNEAINLIDFLTLDFGFQKKDIEINFSGSRGYHIHVMDDAIRNLNSDERREIVDYVAGNLNFKEYLKIDGKTILGPKKDDCGWAGRIYNGIYKFIKDSDREGLKEIKGIGEKRADAIYKNKERILGELDAGRYNFIPEIITIETHSKKTGDPNIMEFAIKDVNSPIVDKIVQERSIKAIGVADADKMVTIDTSRLMRLPDTIHGGSGLKAARVRDLGKFDPLIDAIAFGNEKIKINLIKDVPEFKMNNENFGPFSGIVEIPEYAGIFLLLGGFGDLLQH